MQKIQQKPYKTVLKESVSEINALKGSKFIAKIYPIKSDAEAKNIVEKVKLDYPDARHHCWAYQLLEQGRTRFNDDGEPSGSAGKPILAPIIGNGLFDVLIIVIRYFGGVKLGVGGLVRAYGSASNLVISNAELITVIAKQKILLKYSYNESGAVLSVLNSLGLEFSDIRYTDIITAEILVTFDCIDEVKNQLTEYTAGRISIIIDEKNNI